MLINVMCILYSCSEDPSSGYFLTVKFDPERDADKDIVLAIAEAKQGNKHILLDVGGEWCSWCHKLDKFYKDNSDIAEFMFKNYVVLKINYSPDNKNEKVLAFLKKWASDENSY